MTLLQLLLRLLPFRQRVERKKKRAERRDGCGMLWWWSAFGGRDSKSGLASIYRSNKGAWGNRELECHLHSARQCLSKRKVSEEDIQACEKRYNKSKLVHSIMRHVGETLGIDLEDFKDVMRKVEAVGNNDCPVKIKMVAPPLYVLTTQTLDKVGLCSANITGRGLRVGPILAMYSGSKDGEGRSFQPPCFESVTSATSSDPVSDSDLKPSWEQIFGLHG
ncbi:hypothetical protein PS2_024218 [Malus domestica]